MEGQEISGWYALKQKKKQIQLIKSSMKQPDIQPSNMSLKNKVKVLTIKNKFILTEKKKKNRKVTN